MAFNFSFNPVSRVATRHQLCLCSKVPKTPSTYNPLQSSTQSRCKGFDNKTLKSTQGIQREVKTKQKECIEIKEK
jgi:hypothetical protein